MEFFLENKDHYHSKVRMFHTLNINQILFKYWYKYFGKIQNLDFSQNPWWDLSCKEALILLFLMFNTKTRISFLQGKDKRIYIPVSIFL